jgi:D-alanyl-D-alanine carboxypeptidase/D-alanyl-D-alanine-endopeptidase (penicillin-binding protein 4)
VIRAAFTLLIALLAASCGPKHVAVSPPGALAGIAPAAQRLAQDLASIFGAPEFDRAFWSVLVRPLGSTDNLYALNPQKLMLPGSAMKIITAAAAAERFGWDHRFETRVVTTADVDAGMLDGDLVIVGSGDPSISERSDHPGTLKLIAKQVHDAGVVHIHGGVIGDDDLFDDKGWGDGWTLDNMPYGYSAPVAALLYNEGSVDLVITAGAAAGDPVAIVTRPEGSGLDVENRLVTVEETGTGRLTLRRFPGSSKLIVQGQIPAKAPPFVRTASVDNPTRFFAAAFRDALIAEGVEVMGEVADIDDLASRPRLAEAHTVATWQSPPLGEIINSMMKVSQNQYAEMLFNLVGGRSAVQQILRGWGLADDSYVIGDGSGLSRYNYVSSETLVRVLQRMQTDQRHSPAYLNALPAAGRDGTLAGRLAGTAAEGRVRAKTGTVDNVRAIAGYVESATGELLVFSIIANNFTVANSVVDAAADKALVRLATYSGRH